MSDPKKNDDANKGNEAPEQKPEADPKVQMALEAKDKEIAAKDEALEAKDKEIQDATAKLALAEATATEAVDTKEALQETLEIYQRREADGSEETEEEDDHDVQLEEGKWSKAPKAEIKRVFRVSLFRKGLPYKPNFIALMSKESVLPSGVRIPSQVVSLKPNPALQYVLIEGAIEYDEQLKAARNLEAKGYIKEVNPDHEGSVWLPAKVRAAEKARVEHLKYQVLLDQM